MKWVGVVVVAFALGACDATQDVIGIWTWNPREVLPREQIFDVGFPTPTLEALEIDADGRCTFVEDIPGYDTTVAGKTIHVAAAWREYRGTWSVRKGKLLEIDAEPTSEGVEGRFDRTFEIVEHGKSRLRLKTKAIGDFDRDLHRVAALPKSPR